MHAKIQISRRLFLAIVAALVLAAIPISTLAAPWDFGVVVDVGGIHTDNVFLEPEDLAQSENVLTIAPEFSLTTDGDRITADIRYRPEAYFYQEFSDANDVFHVFDATMNTAIVRDKIFLYMSGSNFQSIVTPTGRYPTSNVPISSNRVDSTVLQARPYWKQRLGAADILLEGSYIDVRYDDPLLQNNTVTLGRFRLDNIDRQKGVALGIEYQNVRSEYELSEPWVYQRAAASVGYWFGGTLRLFGDFGAETPLDNLTESNLSEQFWELGFQYRPNQRLNLEIAAGDRSYGASFRASLQYTLKRGETSLVYREAPTTGGNLPFDRRPIDDDDGLDGILDEPGRADRFIQKRGEWLTKVDLSKSELSLRIFGERREGRIAEDGSTLPNEEYAGAAVRWTWRFGGSTELGLGVDLARRDQDSFNDNIRRMQADLAYYFTKRFSLRFEAQNSKQEGRETAENDYTENQYRILLRSEF